MAGIITMNQAALEEHIRFGDELDKLMIQRFGPKGTPAWDQVNDWLAGMQSHAINAELDPTVWTEKE